MVKKEERNRQIKWKESKKVKKKERNRQRKAKRK